MTNQQFIDYLQGRLAAAREAGDGNQEAMLKEALKMMTHGVGPARRRFKRDYERRLEKERRQAGIMKEYRRIYKIE